ncbi:hypothetical protein BLOT_003988 [Blomia tropicalis]|nr:hypothetical protein BLOT_003988 [Blomia tropicalis]
MVKTIKTDITDLATFYVKAQFEKNRIANNEYVCYDVVGTRVTIFKSVEKVSLNLTIQECNTFMNV